MGGPERPYKYDYIFEGPFGASPSPTLSTATAAPETTPHKDSSKRLPSHVMLKSFHGKYISAKDDGRMMVDSSKGTSSERFEVITKVESTVALKSSHGKFVSADANGKMMNTATSSASDDTSFEVMYASGALVLKSFYGKYVGAERDSSELIADRDSFDDWKQFMVLDGSSKWPAHIALQDAHGAYLMGWPHGRVTMTLRSPPLGSFLRFKVTHNADGTVSLQFDHGEYLSVIPDGSLRAQAQLGGAEKFTVKHIGEFQYTVQDHIGRYLWSTSDRDLKAQDSALKASDSREFGVIFYG